jgi:lysophospholipase L1-like esterase
MTTHRRAVALLLTMLSLTSYAAPRRAWAAVGDSITNGHSFDASPYPLRLATLLNAPVVNMGIGGELAASINTRFTTYVLPYPYKGVIIEECINDLIAGTAGATCWTATEAAANAAIAAGFIVVLVTAVPCGNYASWNGTKETERDAYNAAMRAYAAARPGQVLLLDGDTVLSDDTNTIKAAYDYGDGLHLDGDGFQALAAAIADLIQ